MTTYHVWLTGQQEPEIVRADEVREVEGALYFWDEATNVYQRHQRLDGWRKWAVVHDDADHII